MSGREASVIGRDLVGHKKDFGFYSERNREALGNSEQKTTYSDSCLNRLSLTALLKVS